MGLTQGDTVNRFEGNFDSDELEDRYLFDGAFVAKWVQPREVLLTCSDGKMGWVCLLCVGG